MTTETSQGLFPVAEGVIHWRLDPGSPPPATPRPVLVFFHAAVSDLTLWDAQAAYFVARGWTCLRVDRFGYGQSVASEATLARDPRPTIDHVEHVRLLLDHLLPSNSPVVVIGLSAGGGLALDVATADPPLSVRVVGLAIVAGGVPEIGCDNLPEEDALFEELKQHLDAGDAARGGELYTRIWGDGPLQPEGRMAAPQRAKMLAWNRDIAAREISKTGAGAFKDVERSPRPEKVAVPTAIAYGELDETYTTFAMKHLGREIRGAELKRFDTAHMVNLEAEDEFNSWLSGWLDAIFV